MKETHMSFGGICVINLGSRETTQLRCGTVCNRCVFPGCSANATAGSDSLPATLGGHHGLLHVSASSTAQNPLWAPLLRAHLG